MEMVSLANSSTVVRNPLGVSVNRSVRHSYIGGPNSLRSTSMTK